MPKKKKSYSESLRDPRWQKKRLKVLERDNFLCSSCGDGTTELHVHHKKYIDGKKPWDYRIEMLSTLCSDCHSEIHRKDKIYNVFKSFSNEEINHLLNYTDISKRKISHVDLWNAVNLIIRIKNKDLMFEEIQRDIETFVDSYEKPKPMSPVELKSSLDDLLAMFDEGEECNG